MKSFEQIRTALIEQKAEFLNQDPGTERNLLAVVARYAKTPFPVIISGLRRAGKSTLLLQLARRLYPEGSYFYVNFEDERFLNFSAADFSRLHELLIELFGDRKVFLFDEIQNIPGWERFINRLAKGKYKIYITGSNAALLSRELGTKLTGRYLPLELFPFDFDEYLRFKKIARPNLTRLTTVQKGGLKKAFAAYRQTGGIPQVLQYPQLPLAKTLYNDILHRDVAQRYKITDVKVLRELAFYLFSNIAALISYNKLKQLLKLGSVNTVSAYIEYLQAGWLVFSVNRYAFSVKKQQIANKKIYGIDTGLIKTVSFSFSEDRGKFLENIVFLELCRENRENIYYYKTAGGGEVDFYLPKKKTLIQVCQNLTDTQTYKRETRALAEAIREVKGSRGLVITEAESGRLRLNRQSVPVVPVYEWLLAT